MSKPSMKVFHDWEFEERHGFIDIISAGFVREDGQELYIVFNDFDTLSVARNDWLMKNVMPSIVHMEVTSHVTGMGQPVKDLWINDPAAMSKHLARQRIIQYVSDIRPEWWAWYGAYDHVALCSLFGRMIDLPDGWPFETMDLKQLHKQAGYPQMPQQPSGKHNALDDARFNVVRYNFLTKYLKGKTYIITEHLVAARGAAEKRGLAEDEWVWIREPNDLRGVQISQTRDKVVELVPMSDEMRQQLDLSRRLP